MHVQNRSENCSFLYFNISLLQNGNFNSYKIIVFDFQSILCSKDAMQLKNYKRRKKMHSVQCGKPFFSNTRQNGEWTETSTRQNEIELAMFGE